MKVLIEVYANPECTQLLWSQELEATVEDKENGYTMSWAEDVTLGADQYIKITPLLGNKGAS